MTKQKIWSLEKMGTLLKNILKETVPWEKERQTNVPTTPLATVEAKAMAAIPQASTPSGRRKRQADSADTTINTDIVNIPYQKWFILNRCRIIYQQRLIT
jgi:hypothetical protein